MKKKTTKRPVNPNPLTPADAIRIASKWCKRVSRATCELLCDANVEVSKRRIVLRAWQVRPDGSVRMYCNRFIYLSTTSPTEARAAWAHFWEGAGV